MRRLILLLGVLLSVPFAYAQEAPTPSAINAVVTGPADIAVGRTIILDASASKVSGENVQYRWYIGESQQPISRTVEAVYTPERTGELLFRLVIQSQVNGETQTSEAEHMVVVFTRKVVLLADPEVTEEKLLLHMQSAVAAGVYLKVLQPEDAATPLGIEEALTSLLVEEGGAFAGAETVVIWTDSIGGIQALMRAAEANPELLASVEGRSIILLTSGSLQTLSRTAGGPFSVLKPAQILITRKEAMNPLLSGGSIEQFLTDLEQRDIDVLTLDASSTGIRPWNLLSTLVNYMLAHGVSTQTVLLLLVLPVIATILAFVKQIIGITTFGLFAPSIIALSFLVLGWRVGVLFLISILATGYATRAFMRRWRLLYIPKVAVILTVVSVTLMLLLALGASFGMPFSRDTVFVLLIMSTLAESFLNLKTEEGWTTALLEVGETILIALLCVFLVQWPPFQSVLLAYPELLILTIVADVIIGRWTGLRIVEYFRFREVFRHLQEEE